MQLGHFETRHTGVALHSPDDFLEAPGVFQPSNLKFMVFWATVRSGIDIDRCKYIWNDHTRIASGFFNITICNLVKGDRLGRFAGVGTGASPTSSAPVANKPNAIASDG